MPSKAGYLGKAPGSRPSELWPPRSAFPEAPSWPASITWSLRAPFAAARAGTYVIGRPSWATRRADSSIAALLLRRVAGDRETTDLSISCPGDLGHLPQVDLTEVWSSLDGRGLDTSGLPQLRAEVARHLSEHQQLPTEPGQIVITAGAQEALWLLSSPSSRDRAPW